MAVLVALLGGVPRYSTVPLLESRTRKTWSCCSKSMPQTWHPVAEEMYSLTVKLSAGADKS